MDDGIPVLVTAVYDVRQAVLAAAAGARWIAPYVGRMSDAGRDIGTQISQMTQVLSGTGTGILAASIRKVDDVVRLATAGARAVTVGTQVAAELFEEDLTDVAVAQFDDAVAQLR